MPGIIILELNRPVRLIIGEILSANGYQAILVESFDQAQEALYEAGSVALIMGACGDEAEKNHFIGSLLDNPASSHKRIIMLQQDATAQQGSVADVPLVPGAAGGGVDNGVFQLVRPLDPYALMQAVNGQVAATIATASTNAQVAENEALIAAEPAGDRDSGQASGQAEMDLAAVDDLIELGGRDFALEIIEQFVADGARILASIAKSAMSADAAGFREQAHALRSCAANVGARGVYGICLELREASRDQLGANGPVYVSSLEQEFSAAAGTLRQYLDAMMTASGDAGEEKSSASDAIQIRRAAS